MDIVIFDLDDTLVITKALKELREKRQWGLVKNNIHKTYMLEKMKKWHEGFIKRNYKIVVVTNSPKSYAEQVLKYHDLKYDLIIGYHDTKLHKPSCEPYKKALDNFSNYDKIIIIGNEIKDMIAATDLYNKYKIETKNYLFNCSKEDLNKNKIEIEKNGYIIL